MPEKTTPSATDFRVQMLTELRALAEAPKSSSDAVFVRALKGCREVLEFSDEQLADEIGVSRPTVNRWINGVHLPHPAMRVPVLAWIAREASRRLNIVSGSGTKMRLRGRGSAGAGRS
jgi:DNA-binding XRE family transcriptional regulator